MTYRGPKTGFLQVPLPTLLLHKCGFSAKQSFSLKEPDTFLAHFWVAGLVPCQSMKLIKASQSSLSFGTGSTSSSWLYKIYLHNLWLFTPFLSATPVWPCMACAAYHPGVWAVSICDYSVNLVCSDLGIVCSTIPITLGQMGRVLNIKPDFKECRY